MNVVDFSLKLIKVDAMPVIQKSSYKLEISKCEHLTASSLMSVWIVYNAMSMKVYEQLINKGLFDTKNITYHLHNESLLPENWYLCLEIFRN